MINVIEILRENPAKCWFGGHYIQNYSNFIHKFEATSCSNYVEPTTMRTALTLAIDNSLAVTIPQSSLQKNDRKTQAFFTFKEFSATSEWCKQIQIYGASIEIRNLSAKNGTEISQTKSV